jgi:hypothetical protein
VSSKDASQIPPSSTVLLFADWLRPGMVVYMPCSYIPGLVYGCPWGGPVPHDRQEHHKVTLTSVLVSGKGTIRLTGVSDLGEHVGGLVSFEFGARVDLVSVVDKLDRATLLKVGIPIPDLSDSDGLSTTDFELRD